LTAGDSEGRKHAVLAFDSGDEPTIVQSASGTNNPNGLPVPARQRSKLACTRALLLNAICAFDSMVGISKGIARYDDAPARLWPVSTLAPWTKRGSFR
jgi:hypothetical protein